MDLKKIKEIIESTEGFQENPACMELANCFQTVIELEEKLHRGEIDLVEVFLPQLGAQIERFWTSFDKAAESLGMDPDIKNHINDPEYFPEEQWAVMQSLAQEIKGGE